MEKGFLYDTPILQIMLMTQMENEKDLMIQEEKETDESDSSTGYPKSVESDTDENDDSEDPLFDPKPST